MTSANQKQANILLGVGGGIAAFKVAALASQLVQAGQVVRVAMTPKACEFIGALTFAGLTGSQVILSSTQIDADGSPPHIVATQAADLMVIAPASAGLLSSLAAGACSDAVSLAALTCRAPKLCCPAMNDAMWESPAVQRNVQILKDQGYHFCGPVTGHLAEGYDAIGRMVEPDTIQAEIQRLLADSSS